MAATHPAPRDNSLMDKAAITEAYQHAVEAFLTTNFSISNLIQRLGGGEGGKLQLIDLLGGNPNTARRNINRWLAHERGEPKQARKPSPKSLARLHSIFLKTAQRIKVSAPGIYTDYTGKRSAYRNIHNVSPPAVDRNAVANFIEALQRGDTVQAWDAILDWYGVFPGALIPEPGQVQVSISFE